MGQWYKESQSIFFTQIPIFFTWLIFYHLCFILPSPLFMAISSSHQYLCLYLFFLLSFFFLFFSFSFFLLLFSHSVVPDSLRPMDCSPAGSFVCGILQATMESVAISFSTPSFQLFLYIFTTNRNILLYNYSIIIKIINQHEYNIIIYSIDFIWRRQWHPTPVLLPGKSHGWRTLEGCTP